MGSKRFKLNKKGDATVNPFVFGIILYIVFLNVLLLMISDSFEEGNVNPINTVSYSSSINETINDSSDFNLWEGIKNFFTGFSRYLDIFTFGDFFNLDTLNSALTRFFITSVFQILPLIVIFMGLADWGRGK